MQDRIYTRKNESINQERSNRHYESGIMKREVGRESRVVKRKILFFSFLAAFFFFSMAVYFLFLKADPEMWSESMQKSIMVTDGGFDFSFTDVAEKTVGEFLITKKLSLEAGDSIFPDETAALFSGTRIHIARAHPMTVFVDGETKNIRTQALTVAGGLADAGIVLEEDDIVKPAREAFAQSGVKVTVIRVEMREESVEKPIAFAKKVNEDDQLSWRKNIVTQKGEKGVERLTYRVSSHDGKEVNRTLLKTETVKEPVTEITTQGTYVQVGKTHKGVASWYAYTGTLSAANPWLPMGSSVRVTNLDNGKSVIVKINDRGPFGPGRIIDLDKVAFARIASIGTGVINVKMEEITN